MSLVTIAADDVAEYPNGPLVPAFARLYASDDFRTSEGIYVSHGNPNNGSAGFYQEFTASMNGDFIRIASGTAYSTTDALVHPNVTYTLIVYDANGTKIKQIFENIAIPPSSPTTWATLQILATGSRQFAYSPRYSSDPAIMAILSQYQNAALKAANAVIGVTELDTDPSDLAHPKAVGINSPLVTTKASTSALGKIKLDTAPADPNNPIAVGPNSPALVVPLGTAATPGKIQLDTAPADSAHPTAVGTNSATILNIDNRLPVFNILRHGAPAGGGNATSAINSAITAAADKGGVVYLPPGLWTSTGGHNWPQGVYFRGEWAHPDGINGTRLQLLTSGTYLFKIVPGTRGLGARNVTFLGGGLANTDGILVEGVYGQPVIDLHFENCGFNSFKYGYRINATDNEMQIQQLHFDKCLFTANSAAAFYCNSNNTLIRFNGGTILVPDNGWAIYSDSIGMFKAEGVEFVGSPGYLPPSGLMPNTGMAEGVAYFDGHINVAEFSNCEDEGFRYFIRHVEPTQPDAIIALNENLIQSRISLEARVRVRSRNNYYSWSRTFRDIVTSGSYVTSENDEFGLILDTGEAALATAEPAAFLSPDTKLVVSRNQATGLAKGFVQQWPQKFIRPNEFDGSWTQGVVQALSESSGMKTLEWGECDVNGNPVSGNTYWMTRSASTGRNEFHGGQAGFEGNDFYDGAVVAYEGFIHSMPVALTDDDADLFITVNSLLSNSFYMTLTGNWGIAMGVLAGENQDRSDGRIVSIEITQDATGSRTLALATGAGQFKFGTDITSILLTTTASKTDILTVQYSKRLDRWLVKDFKKGY